MTEGDFARLELKMDFGGIGNTGSGPYVIYNVSGMLWFNKNTEE